MFSHAFCALLLALAASAAPSKNDNELWSELDVTASFGRTNLTLLAVDRTSFQLANPQLGGAGIVADVRLTPWLTASPGFLVAGLPNTGAGYLVKAPLFALSLNHSFGRWSVKDRNRFERLYGLPGEPYRYRQRLEAGYAVTRRLRFFAADEVFCQFGIDRWNQSRAQAGVSAALSKAAALDLYFLERNTSAAPKTTRGIGVTLHLIFLKKERP